jgi:molybdopterin molybdotransferase
VRVRPDRGEDQAVISVEAARAHVLGAVSALPPRSHPLADALGLVLAEEVVAHDPVPPFAGSAMDGFAVRAGDTVPPAGATAAQLTVVDTVSAGQAPTVPVGPGEAIRIMTGAPMPEGADAVVMVEHTQLADDGVTVVIVEPVTPGTAVRPAADDIAPGELVFGPGEILSAAHLGVLASVGRTAVTAHPRPRVGVFSTGDELVDAGEALRPGQIRDSNRLTLLALLSTSGCDGVDLGRVPDDEGAITDAVRHAVASCDAVVTSGGVSMGDFDFVKVVLDRLGDMRWMQVEVKPAKPLAFGTVGRHEPGSSSPDDGGGGPPRPVPVFGLPGNPVSSMVSFELFARPALRRMAGHAPAGLDRPRVSAVADGPLSRRRDGKVHCVRVVCEWDPVSAGYRVRSAGAQGSHQLRSMAAANALAIVPDGPGVEAGGRVEVLLLVP